MQRRRWPDLVFGSVAGVVGGPGWLQPAPGGPISGRGFCRAVVFIRRLWRPQDRFAPSPTFGERFHGRTLRSRNSVSGYRDVCTAVRRYCVSRSGALTNAARSVFVRPSRRSRLPERICSLVVRAAVQMVPNQTPGLRPMRQPGDCRRRRQHLPQSGNVRNLGSPRPYFTCRVGSRLLTGRRRRLLRDQAGR